MKTTPLAVRCALLLLAVLIGLALAAGPLQAAPPPDTPAPALLGGLKEYIIGDRSRMVQFTFIGFAIAVAILVTATRKH